jgi:chromosomal replication initiator protein
MSLSPSEAWSRLLERARHDLPPEAYESWLAPANPVSYSEQTISISVPDQFAAEWNDRNYSELLAGYGPIALGHAIRVVFQADPERAQRPQMDFFSPPAIQARSFVAKPEFPESQFQPLSTRYTFSEFVVGKSNELAAAAASAVARQPGKAYNPLFIYGETGLGKTHLMQAIGHEAIQFNPQLRIVYIGIEQFTNEFVQAVQSKGMAGFKRRFREVDLLLVDDAQFLKGKEGTQEEFFHTFNTLYEAGRQIVLTSDRSPNEIPKLEARLVSRFQSGMVADIGHPDFEHRLAILHQKMRRDHLEQSFPDDVLSFLAEQIRSNVRELEGCIIKLLAFASLKHRDVTLELAQEVLRDRIQPLDLQAPASSQQTSVSAIQQMVAAEWGVSAEALISKSRLKAYTVPRQVAMYLIRKILHNSLVHIGEAFGHRDHSTVIHSLERVETQIQLDEHFRNRVNRLYDHVKLTT